MFKTPTETNFYFYFSIKHVGQQEKEEICISF